MAALFEKDGIRFRYPENWQLESETTDHGWTISLQGPGTAFLVLAVDEDLPEIEQVAETVLAALRDDYPDLEADECVDSIAGQPAFGHNIRFFSFDLTNTCWTRCFLGGGGTVLLMCQVNDLELAESEDIFKAICASMEMDE